MLQTSLKNVNYTTIHHRQNGFFLRSWKPLINVMNKWTRQLLLSDMTLHCTKPDQIYLLLFYSSPEQGYFLAINPVGPERALFPLTHPFQSAKITWPYPQPMHFNLKMDAVNSSELRPSLMGCYAAHVASW